MKLTYSSTQDTQGLPELSIIYPLQLKAPNLDGLSSWGEEVCLVMPQSPRDDSLNVIVSVYSKPSVSPSWNHQLGKMWDTCDECKMVWLASNKFL